MRTMPRLAPTLVPEPLWDISAYRVLPSSAWKRIRDDAIRIADGKCEICAAALPRGMVCHEIWAYDDADSVARLQSFGLLCPACNGAHHLGRISQLGLADQAVQHMASVNETSVAATNALVADAFVEFHRRSSHPWHITVAPELLKLYPELKVLDGASGMPGDGRQRVRTRHRKT